MRELIRAIQCEIPGFEGVSVSYDLLATPEKVDLFVRLMGQGGSHVGVIAKVEGWPVDDWGPEPWNEKRVPGVWFAWASKKGWSIAMKAYLEDPN